jgi:hypothetical protein
MKTKLFRKPFTFLLLSFAVSPLCAKNGITISDFSANVGTGGATLTFNVGWDKNATNMPAIWRDSAWVFADYNNTGTMTRLQLSGATLTATSAPGVGKVIKVSGNNEGVWVIGNAKAGNSGGAFSATVQLHTSATYLAGACVYAINYPPVGQYTAADQIKFTGTPPFDLEFNEGGSTYLLRETAANTYTLPSGKTLKTFTDASRTPGLFKYKTPDTQTLVASSSAHCAGANGVRLALQQTERGVVYQLYNGATAISGASLTGNGSAATFSGTYTTGQYTAKAIQQGAFSEALMNGAPTVTVTPLPTITLTGDKQTVSQGAALATAITFVTTNASGATITGGAIPDGLSAVWSSPNYTIKGTVIYTAAAQAYSFTVTTRNTCDYTNVSATVSVTVQALTTNCPPDANAIPTVCATVGTQRWSGPRAISAGCIYSENTGTENPPPVAYYLPSDRAELVYHYNSTCVQEHGNGTSGVLCPSPWRVPTRGDFCLLYKTLTSRSNCSYPDTLDTFVHTRMQEWWGHKHRGRYSDWFTPAEQYNLTWYMTIEYRYDGEVFRQSNLRYERGMWIMNYSLGYNADIVRCVKDE